MWQIVIRFIKVCWRESRGVRAGILGTMVCGVVSVGLSLLAVWATREIVEAACAGDREGLGWLSAVFCGLLAGRLLVSKGGQRLEAWCITRCSNRLRLRLFDRIMHAGFDSGKELHSADVVSRLSTDVGNISAVVCSTVPAMVVSLVSFAGAFVYLAALAPWVAVVVAVLMPLAIGVGKLPASRTYSLTRRIRLEETGISRMMQDDVRHRVLLSTLGYSDRAVDEFEEGQREFYRLTMRRNDLGLFAGGAVSLGLMGGYAVMFLYCAYGIVDGTVSFATMTALLQLVAMVQRPAVDVSHKLSPLVRAWVSMERVGDVEGRYEGSAQLPAGKESGDGLSFDHVWFRYDESGGYVLEDFSAAIHGGEVTAIYGATGAGKTTLLRMMLGLCVPQRGRVVSAFNSPGYGNVVYIPQGNTLISGTVKSNLLMGDPEGSEREMSEALHLAAAEFVERLPEGVMTRCGENGYGFSEGQAQRIAVARGMMRVMRLKKEGAGRVLVLMDEPTNALDAATGGRMMERLTGFLRGETVVMVTHDGRLEEFAAQTITI